MLRRALFDGARIARWRAPRACAHKTLLLLRCVASLVAAWHAQMRALEERARRQVESERARVRTELQGAQSRLQLLRRKQGAVLALVDACMGSPTADDAGLDMRQQLLPPDSSAHANHAPEHGQPPHGQLPHGMQWDGWLPGRHQATGSPE
jgi:hypothetical protein